MDSLRMLRATLVALPMLALAACGGSSGGGDEPAETASTTVPLTGTAATVPLVGEVIADCTDAGVGLVDSIVDTVGNVAGGPLPVDLPALADVLDVADAALLPILGAVLPTEEGALVPISLDELLALVPGGAALGGLPVLGQLPTVCSSLLGGLPVGAGTDPAVLVDALGDPTSAIGAIAVLDGDDNPVGVLLATVPALLAGGNGGLPILGELLPIDPLGLPLLGDLVATLLGLLSGGSVGGLGGLGGLLGILGLLPL